MLLLKLSSVPLAEDVAAAESFADSVSPVVDVSTAAECASAVEPLTSYWPPDLVVHAVSYMNTTVGLEWYQAIIASTVAVRFLLAPFAIYLVRARSNLDPARVPKRTNASANIVRVVPHILTDERSF